MQNVHHIAEKSPLEFDYHGEHIVITHRKSTNDFEYSFVMVRSMPFTGHSSTYDNCVNDAQKRVDSVTGTGI